MDDPVARARELATAETLYQSPLGEGAPELPRFELLGELGGGGMGVVFRARDRETGEVVALKVLRSELRTAPELIERFKNELRLARRVTHRNVCRIHELGRSDDLVYITMELVEGESLRQRLRRSGKLVPAEAAALTSQICAGLAEAHRLGITHRDLKPENVMVAADGEVKVLDFGLARSLDPGLTGSGQLLGTPAYMAPEQATGGEIGPATDVYAAGLILYELLTGRAAIQGASPVEMALNQVRETPPPPRALEPGVPEELERVAMRCLEKEPGRRYADAQQLGEALARWESSAAELSARTPRRGRRPAWWAAAAAALAATVLAAWYLAGRPGAVAEPPLERYRLANGMQVVLAPDPGADGVGVAVAYDAGLHNEPPGLAGSTHFAEHMLFQGSANVARGEHRRTVEAAGGKSNGFVTGDALVTYSVVPAEQLELALFLEADRMRSPRFDEEVVERERRVMLEEHLQRVGSQAYGGLPELLRESLYAPLPQRRALTGTREGILAATAADLQAYASRVLVPQRAVVAVSGKVEQGQARRLVEKHFAPLPSGPAAPSAAPPAWPASGGPQRRVLELPRAPSPILAIAYRLPGRTSPAHGALDAALRVLAEGEGSRLHRLLVEEHEVATLVSPFVETLGPLASGAVWIFVKEGKPPELVEQLAHEAFAALAKDGPTEAELQRVGRLRELSVEAGRVSRPSSTAELARDALVYGEPRLRRVELERLRQLDAQDVLAAVRRWLVPAHQVTVVGVPGGEAPPLPPLPPPLPPLPDEPLLGRAPVAQGPIAVSLPPIERLRLRNGVVLLIVDQPSFPVLDFRLWGLSAGSLFEPASQAGVATVTAHVLPLGTGSRSGAELTQALHASGSWVWRSTDEAAEAADLRAAGLPATAGAWIPLLTEIWTAPSLPADGVARRQRELSALAARRQAEVLAVAEAQARRSIYGDHPAARTLDAAAVSRLSARDVTEWYRERFSPARTVAVLRGPLSAAARGAAEDALGAWRGTEAPPAEWPEVGPRRPATTTVLDGSPQGAVLVAARTVSRSHADFPVLAVLETVLTERLYHRLRQQQGLVYTPDAELEQQPFPGLALVRARTDTSTTFAVLAAVLDELARLRAARVPATELAGARRGAAGRFALSLREDLPGYLMMQQAHGFSPGYWEAYPKKLQAVSAAEVQEAAATYLDPAVLHVVVGGDAATLVPALVELGLGPPTVLPFAAGAGDAPDLAAASP